MAAVIVAPDLVGMPFHHARDRAVDLGLVIASFDPDGPPIGAVAWPGAFVVTGQDPAPGTRLSAGGSIRVAIAREPSPG